MRSANRASMFVLKGLALLVIAIAALSVAPEREAGAGGFELEGIHCLDVYLDNTPVEPKGDPPGVEDDRATKILTRIDPTGSGLVWDLTQIAYSGPGDPVPTKPPTTNDCTVKGDGNTLNPSVPFQGINLNQRPTASADLVTKGPDLNLEWEICQFQEDLFDGTFVLSVFELVVDGNPATPDYGKLFAFLNTVECPDGMGTPAFELVIESTQRDDNKGAPSGGLDDDWDGDGVTDWNELALVPPEGFCDPFNPNPCDVVGGIAELPDVTGAPAQAIDAADGGVNALVAAAIAVGAGVAGIAAGAWYLQRRRES